MGRDALSGLSRGLSGLGVRDGRGRVGDRRLRDLRVLGLLRGLGGLRLLGVLRLLGGLRDLRLLGVLRLLGGLGLLRVLRLTGGNGADGGGHRDGLGGDDGAVRRAVRDLRGAVGDGDDLGGVDSRGGHGDSAGLDGGRVSRAVGDGRLAVGDSDQLGGVVGGDRLGGHGTSGQERSSSEETHLDGIGWVGWLL